MSGEGIMDHLDSERDLGSESKADLYSPRCSVWAAATTKFMLPKLEGQLKGLKIGPNG